MKRQIRAKLQLDECVRPEQLVESGECFESGRTRPEAPASAAAGQKKSALQTQNRTGIQVRHHHALQGQRGVPYTAVPDMVLILKSNGDVHLDLVLHPKSLFMDDVGFVAGGALCIDRS